MTYRTYRVRVQREQYVLVVEGSKIRCGGESLRQWGLMREGLLLIYHGNVKRWQRAMVAGLMSLAVFSVVGACASDGTKGPPPPTADQVRSHADRAFEKLKQEEQESAPSHRWHLRGAGTLGACPTLTVLLRRTIRDHLRRSRPEKILNVFQRIHLRFFRACGLASRRTSFACHEGNVGQAPTDSIWVGSRPQAGQWVSRAAIPRGVVVEECSPLGALHGRCQEGWTRPAAARRPRERRQKANSMQAGG